jgi:excisionase family DNA binding protein
MTDRVEAQIGKSENNLVRAEEKLLLSRQEAAALLSISQRSLDYLIANKVLIVRRIGSRVLIPAQELRRCTTLAALTSFHKEPPFRLFS